MRWVCVQAWALHVSRSLIGHHQLLDAPSEKELLTYGAPTDGDKSVPGTQPCSFGLVTDGVSKTWVCALLSLASCKRSPVDASVFKTSWLWG